MIFVDKLNKLFGSKTAVENLSFSVEGGKVLGLIGQNGAGKTTTFRMILDFIQPSSGKILFDGNLINPQLKKKIGFLPEERGLYQKDTIENQILYFSELHGMTRYDARVALKDWMNRLEVVGKLDDKVQSLSKGNAQKVQLIATTIFEPELLILDEPFTGLDPVNTSLMMNEIERLKDQGTAIIFSSHNMEGVERISDDLLMLGNGKTLMQGKVDEIREGFGRTKLYIESNLQPDYFENINGVVSVSRKKRGLDIVISNEKIGKDIFKKIVRDQEYISVFSQQPPTLDEIFRKTVLNNKE